jgi:hypothetical protein
MLTIGWWDEPNRAKKLRQVEFVIFFTSAEIRNKFGLASVAVAPILYAARTPRVRMFIEAEKKKST